MSLAATVLAKAGPGMGAVEPGAAAVAVAPGAPAVWLDAAVESDGLAGPAAELAGLEQAARLKAVRAAPATRKREVMARKSQGDACVINITRSLPVPALVRRLPSHGFDQRGRDL